MCSFGEVVDMLVKVDILVAALALWPTLVKEDAANVWIELVPHIDIFLNLGSLVGQIV